MYGGKLVGILMSFFLFFWYMGVFYGFLGKVFLELSRVLWMFLLENFLWGFGVWRGKVGEREMVRCVVGVMNKGERRVWLFLVGLIGLVDFGCRGV